MTPTSIAGSGTGAAPGSARMPALTKRMRTLEALTVFSSVKVTSAWAAPVAPVMPTAAMSL